MKLSDILVLNPNYFIRHDETRSLLWARDEKASENSFSYPFHSFIHPYHGQLLSFFNGSNTIEDVLDKSILGRKDRKGTIDFITRLIGNEKLFRVSNYEVELAFPTNLLLKKSEVTVLPIILEQDYSFNELDFKTQKLNFPLFITYMVNTICYTDCIYCYADCRVRRKRQLSIEKVTELFDEIEKHPIIDFVIMGGEFLLDENWELILSRLKKLGLSPVISTKIPVSEEVIQKLKELGVNKLQLSLDSVNPDTLNKMLKVNGEKYLSDMGKTLSLLKKYNIATRVNFVITKYNAAIDELENLLFYLTDYNISSVTLSVAALSLYKPNCYMASEEAINLLKSYVADKKRSFNFDLNVAFSIPKECFVGCTSVKQQYFETRSLCTGNLWQAFIMPNGDVTFCEGTMSQKEFILGNIQEKSFGEVWKTANSSHLWNKENYKDTVCGECKSFDECHKGKGVCWKLVAQGYGNENMYLPDPRCPKAPPMKNRIF